MNKDYTYEELLKKKNDEEFKKQYPFIYAFMMSVRKDKEKK